MLAAWLADVQLLPLHGPDGQEFYVASGQITSLRAPVRGDLRHFPANTHCIIVTTSGKFLATREGCGEVRAMIVQHQPMVPP